MSYFFDFKETCEQLEQNKCEQIEDTGMLSLGFSRNGELKILMELLKKNSSVTKLKIVNNRFTVDELKMICDMLKVNQTITYLDFSDNNLDLPSMKLFSDMLKVNQTIRELDFSRSARHPDCKNYMYYLTENIKVFSEGLQNNKGIEKLDLSANYIFHHSAVYLLQVLKNNRSLTQLNLDDNQLDLEAIDKIISALKDNSTIQKLTLIGNVAKFIDSNGDCLRDEQHVIQTRSKKEQEELESAFQAKINNHIKNNFKRLRENFVLGLDNKTGKNSSPILALLKSGMASKHPISLIFDFAGCAKEETLPLKETPMLKKEIEERKKLGQN